MKVEKNKMVSLTYRLTENDAQGILIEETKAEQPFDFLFGVDGVIPGFEDNLRNLQVDDAFAFAVEAKDAYGAYDDNGVVELPITVFQKDGKLDTNICVVGNMIPLRGENGQPFYGIVKEIKESVVVMDFNHPLAGKNLFFSGRIIGIRDASKEEICQRQGHNDEGHDCSCGCSC